MKRFALFTMLSVLLSAAGIASAHTMGESTNTCPVCTHTFTCMLDRSGTSFGMRLDLKPLGPIAAPWRVPVCTECNFVIYSEDIPEEELARCRNIVASAEYKSHSGRASYFLMALIFEGLDKDPNSIAHTYLKASWQEEENAMLLTDDLERSLRSFEGYLREDGAGEGYQTAQLLKGELLRRLGRFDEAQQYLKGLLKGDTIEDDFMKEILRYQINLCEKKDSMPQDLSKVSQ